MPWHLSTYLLEVIDRRCFPALYPQTNIRAFPLKTVTSIIGPRATLSLLLNNLLLFSTTGAPHISPKTHNRMKTSFFGDFALDSFNLSIFNQKRPYVQLRFRLLRKNELVRELLRN